MLTRLIATAGVHRQRISLQMATDMLHETIASSKEGKITMDMIKAASAQFFGIRQTDLTSSRRSRSITFPRQVAMYLCRQLTTSSLSEISRAFGKKDHTTVMHACRKIDELITTDSAQAALIQSLRDEIEA
jgi:chromosomal replication initiator protein